MIGPEYLPFVASGKRPSGGGSGIYYLVEIGERQIGELILDVLQQINSFIESIVSTVFIFSFKLHGSEGTTGLRRHVIGLTAYAYKRADTYAKRSMSGAHSFSLIRAVSLLLASSTAFCEKMGETTLTQEGNEQSTSYESGGRRRKF
ncbi:hypothetical protein G2W53_037702 [Senna tora]|uniref:Uncharacterized protein n=1 Tax=Senna tora TaxID=362788 RepID=A0A834SLE8_9FABA|nr:hypothetical protein G2W53_037702 [Senna tora]